ncbi:uncharacterized protein Z519_05841 [Cladophialophora bantiana CBS 173.52]|uniref:SP-RING-type domain-containing protein n=1 Tax=Cladophialophora bantiana (strain ATCC 10958 / CBS 173.52 / CDC B-1940 / NIH 8579) TaxID=1442370 RepID=A0A0D2ETI3_CLAB1|nr:uncharacterized protein Z519_05841 [Cladophialophora bantiana CBS 173.52]KIW93236.1 hypothetical protein Z519_05841 [Cladophialophora bantiana CBS 173.52]
MAPRRSEEPKRFEPQPLLTPLNDEALFLLGQLQQERDREMKVREYLKRAAERLTDITGELNDRAYLYKIRHSKIIARRIDARGTENAAEDNTEADARYEEFQQRVAALTKRMDLSIRGVIDDMAWLAKYPETLKTVVEKAHDTTEEQRSNSQTASPTPLRRTRQRAIVDDGYSGDEEQERTEPRSSPRRARQISLFPRIQPVDTPHIQLSTALTQQSRAWASKTLTERYARNNDYRGWYRVLYDANNPGESAPPMPDESLWFAAEEGRGSLSSSHRLRRRHALDRRSRGTSEAGSSDDNDLEIAAEKTRLKCPITLLPYVDPVTSKNCNHSYERDAILSMLTTSTSFVPFTPTQLAELSQLGDKKRSQREGQIRVKQVKCPECNVPLVQDDLVENPALKRRVARLLAQAQKDDIATSDVDNGDDESDGREGIIRGTQKRPVGLGSSPSPTRRHTPNPIKAERESRAAEVGMIPQTQLADEEDRRIPRIASQQERPRPAPQGRERTRRMRHIMDVDDADDG